MHRFLVLSLLLSLLMACGDGLEEREEIDALGFRTVERVDPETGLLEGVAEKYTPDGKLLSRAHYRNGELDGERTLYYPNGQVDVVENYRNGKFDGPYMTYDSAGNLTLHGLYIDGAMNKVWTGYHPDGGVAEVVTMVDNLENGPFREWYPNGKPKASGNYLEGDDEDGTLFLYQETGGLERIMQCDRGACKTIWTPDSTSVAPAAPDMTRPEPAAKGS